MTKAHVVLPTFARALFAVVALVVAFAASSIATGSGVYSTTLMVSDEGGFYAFAVPQANLQRCVASIESISAIKERSDQTIVETQISFMKANDCEGVTLTVNAIDNKGRESTGTLTPLPVGAKQKVSVEMFGEARRNAKPQFYLNIA